MINENYGLWERNVGLIDLRTTAILSRRRRNLHQYQLIAPKVFLEKGSENYTDLDDYQSVFEQWISCRLNIELFPFIFQPQPNRYNFKAIAVDHNALDGVYKRNNARWCSSDVGIQR